MKQRTPAERKAISAHVWRLFTHGHDDRAVVMAKKAIRIAQHDVGPDHPDTATSLHDLAVLYDCLDRYAEAEPLYKRSLAIAEKVLGPDRPYMSTILNNIAELYDAQGQPALAEPLHQRSQAIKSMWRQRRNDELYQAAGRANVRRVRSLLAAGADPAYRGEEETPLHETIIYHHPGRMTVAKLLIEQQRIDDDGWFTVRNGRQVDRYVDADSDFGTPLGIAVDNDDIRMVKFLLDHNAHPDADGCSGGTPLHRAAKSGNVRILKLLLDRMEQLRDESGGQVEDGDVDVRSSSNGDDATPLHVAADEGQLGTASLLLAAGANVNAADAEGETPLYKAACRGYRTTVEWLLEAGAAVDGTEDKSPLAAAAAAGARDVVAMLVKAGASLDATDDGSTTLSLARNHHHKAIASLLQKAEALTQAEEKLRRKKSGKGKTTPGMRASAASSRTRR